MHASIFPGQSVADLNLLGREIMQALLRVPFGLRRNVFSIALNILESGWSSVQIVALVPPPKLTDVVQIPGEQVALQQVSKENL